MKKLTLGLGSIAAIVAPVSAVVACGSESKESGTPATETVTPASLAAATIEKQGQTLSTATWNTGKAMHFVFDSLKDIPAKTTDNTQSSEFVLYYDTIAGNGVGFHMSKNIDFIFALAEKTGIPFGKFLPLVTKPVDQTAANTKNGVSTATAASHHITAQDKILTEAEAKELMHLISEAIKSGKLPVKAGDKVVINHIKMDKHYTAGTGAPGPLNHLTVDATKDESEVTF